MLGLSQPGIAQPSTSTETAWGSSGRPRRGILDLDPTLRIDGQMGPERGLDTFNYKVLQHLDTQCDGKLVQGSQGPRPLPVPCRLRVQGTGVQEVVNRLAYI